MKFLKIFDSIDRLNLFAAEKIIEIAEKSIKERGRLTIALAGGSTPKALYRLLSSEEVKSKINWNAVNFFFGDERNVPTDSDESNFKMANETLLKPLNINKDNVCRWKTELQKPEKVAFEYAERVDQFFGGNPTFDLILLGMGDDGHTASLFPFTEALKESAQSAVANPVDKLDATRFTLTFPVINNARNVMFLVKGADKAETLQSVLEGEFQPEKFPAQAVNPVDGELYWLVEKEAARFLK